MITIKALCCLQFFVMRDADWQNCVSISACLELPPEQATSGESARGIHQLATVHGKDAVLPADKLQSILFHTPRNRIPANFFNYLSNSKFVVIHNAVIYLYLNFLIKIFDLSN